MLFVKLQLEILNVKKTVLWQEIPSKNAAYAIAIFSHAPLNAWM